MNVKPAGVVWRQGKDASLPADVFRARRALRRRTILVAQNVQLCDVVRSPDDNCLVGRAPPPRDGPE